MRDTPLQTTCQSKIDEPLRRRASPEDNETARVFDNGRRHVTRRFGDDETPSLAYFAALQKQAAVEVLHTLNRGDTAGPMRHADDFLLRVDSDKVGEIDLFSRAALTFAVLRTLEHGAERTEERHRAIIGVAA